MEIPTPSPMKFDVPNVAEGWKKWEKSFEVYRTAREAFKKPEKVQVALLLHRAGPDAQTIFDTFQFRSGESKEKYSDVLQKFREYVEPHRNVVYERYLFWTRDQQEDEPVDSWLTDLRTKASRCEFGSADVTDTMIRDKIVFGVRSERVKMKLLKQRDLDLNAAVEICRVDEVSTKQFQRMRQERTPSGGNIDVIQGQKQPKRHVPQQGSQRGMCHYCGSSYPYGQCPAYGKTCTNCNKRHHFARVCMSRNTVDPSQRKSLNILQADNVGDDGPCDDLFIGGINTEKSDAWNVSVNIGKGKMVEMKLDTGADANVINAKDLGESTIFPTHAVLTAFGNNIIKPSGFVMLDCKIGARPCQKLKFYVVDSGLSILGRSACESLDLVQRIQQLRHAEYSPISKEKFLQDYHDVFSGLGEFEKEYDIQVRPDVEPKIQPARNFPFAIPEQLNETLVQLEEKGVIVSVDSPTDWVNNLVVTKKKNGSIRICLDPKSLNQAIKREHFTLPTPAEVQAKLSGKKVFTVLDQRDAYWQVKLTEQSSFLCTFNTPWGRKRFQRMPFGICSASEIIQKRNFETFGDIPGVHCIIDDMIIAGEDDKDHDQILKKVMERARLKNVKFNQSKIQFRVPQVHFMGNIVTADGLRPDDSKVQAIVNMPPPDGKPALRRLLGLVKYLAQYIPHESDITQPLRSLLKEDVQWQWMPEHEEALQKIRDVLSSQPLLRFYDVQKPVTIQADASSSGLGACLLQENQPVAYASRALTSAEKNYSQIEKETLAICFAVAKFHPYVYGKECEIQSDHRPLETVFNRPLSKVPPRLQRMLLQLQRYSLRVTYTPGRLMFLADTLSRAYLENQDTAEGSELEEEMEIMVHELVADKPVSDQKLIELKAATAQDNTLQTLLHVVCEGWPQHRNLLPMEVRPFWHCKEEIHEAEGLLFRGEAIIIPEAMRRGIRVLLHEAHLGIEKTKTRARHLVYWPGINSDIEEMVSQCPICLRYRASNVREPMIAHDIPERPWVKVGADIMTLKGKDYLVVVDYYSKFPEISILEDKTAATLILHFKSIFARHGIPLELVSDNMPFSSAVFKRFAQDWGIKLNPSSPCYPQANGQSERFVQTLKGLLKKAADEGRDPYLALLEYRASPFTGTDFSLAQLLYSRQLRSKLPATSSALRPRVVDGHPQLQQQKLKQIRYYNRGTRPLPALNHGEAVRVRVGNEWQPAMLTGIHSSPRSYTVNHNGQEKRRNRSQLLKTYERRLPATMTSPMGFPATPASRPQEQPARQSPCSSAVTRPQEAGEIPSLFPDQDGDRQVQTSSGRVVRRPTNLRDYVQYVRTYFEGEM